MATCECGRRMNKYANRCTQCTKKEIRRCLEAARIIVANNKCPKCGRRLKHNGSIFGWWQCEQFGAPQFRAEPDKPSCNFQCFTN